MAESKGKGHPKPLSGITNSGTMTVKGNNVPTTSKGKGSVKTGKDLRQK